MWPLPMMHSISLSKAHSYSTRPQPHPPDMRSPSHSPLLVTSGGNHWWPVQTCSLYRATSGGVTTEARMVGKRAVHILLECFLVVENVARWSFPWTLDWVFCCKSAPLWFDPGMRSVGMCWWWWWSWSSTWRSLVSSWRDLVSMRSTYHITQMMRGTNIIWQMSGTHLHMATWQKLSVSLIGDKSSTHLKATTCISNRWKNPSAQHDMYLVRRQGHLIEWQMIRWGLSPWTDRTSG